MSAETKNTNQDEQITDAAKTPAQVTANDAAEAPATDTAEAVNTDQNSSCCGGCS